MHVYMYMYGERFRQAQNSWQSEAQLLFVGRRRWVLASEENEEEEKGRKEEEEGGGRRKEKGEKEEEESLFNADAVNWGEDSERDRATQV